jgi:cell division septation protein DedD
MAIKVLIKRKFKTGSLNQASQLLNRARYSAMGMKGYISSETLTDLRDPHRIVVGPEEMEAYALGMQASA